MKKILWLSIMVAGSVFSSFWDARDRQGFFIDDFRGNLFDIYDETVSKLCFLAMKSGQEDIAKELTAKYLVISDWHNYINQVNQRCARFNGKAIPFPSRDRLNNIAKNDSLSLNTMLFVKAVERLAKDEEL